MRVVFKYLRDVRCEWWIEHLSLSSRVDGEAAHVSTTTQEVVIRYKAEHKGLL
jgi:hypothetical protein